MSNTRSRTRAPRHARPASAVMSFDVEVRQVRQIGANFQRITFGGPCLADFGVQGRQTDDLRIKVVLPSRTADGTALPLPDFDCSRSGWYQEWLQQDPALRGAMRTYTVRSARCSGPEPEIDVDFVLHFDDSGVGGPASSWAAEAKPGDRVCIIGPNAANCTTAEAYGGIEWRPGLARHVLLAGDETAVPAITAILEALPADVTGYALLEVPDAADIQPVHTASSVGVRWLPREGRPHGTLLEGAVRTAVALPGGALPLPRTGREPEDIDIDHAILWETPQRLDAAVLRQTANPEAPAGALPFYAWIAGEAAVVRGLRRYLVRDVGIDRKQVAFMGYWRQGRAEG